MGTIGQAIDNNGWMDSQCCTKVDTQWLFFIHRPGYIEVRGSVDTTWTDATSNREIGGDAA